MMVDELLCEFFPSHTWKGLGPAGPNFHSLLRPTLSSILLTSSLLVLSHYVLLRTTVFVFRFALQSTCNRNIRFTTALLQSDPATWE